MTPRSRWRTLRAEVTSLAIPLVAYAVATGSGLVTVTASILLLDGGPLDAAGIGVLVGIWLATLGGVAAGQLTAVLRLRTWAVVTGFVFSLILTTFLIAAVAMNNLDTLGIVLVVVAFLGPFFFVSGHLSLSTNAGLPSLFAPVVWLTTAILIVADKRGNDAAWFGGDKWAIWDVATAPILGFGVLCALVFLASREQHRLHRWRTDPIAPVPSGTEPDRSVRRAGSGIGCGGALALVALALALTVASAVSAPYLWRSEEDTDGEPDTDAASAPADPDRPDREPQPGDGTSDAGDGPGERIQRAAEQAGASLIALILIVALLLAAIAVFGPPLRRMLLLQHLRRPFWPVSPSRRVAQHWRLAEIALGDGGVPRHPGDDATGLVGRARDQLGFIDADALVRCAEIADRVAYGIAIQPQDAMIARRTAEMTFQTVWDELSEWERFKAMYRAL